MCNGLFVVVDYFYRGVCMNIARMCMVVGVAGLLVVQADVHAMESKVTKKAKKSTRELVMEYLPYVGYVGTALGICGAVHGHYKAKSAFERGQAAKSQEVEDRLSKALGWFFSPKAKVVVGSMGQGAERVECETDTADNIVLNPALVIIFKDFVISGKDPRKDLKMFQSQY